MSSRAADKTNNTSSAGFYTSSPVGSVPIRDLYPPRDPAWTGRSSVQGLCEVEEMLDVVLLTLSQLFQPALLTAGALWC